MWLSVEATGASEKARPRGSRPAVDLGRGALAPLRLPLTLHPLGEKYGTAHFPFWLRQLEPTN